MKLELPWPTLDNARSCTSVLSGTVFKEKVTVKTLYDRHSVYTKLVCLERYNNRLSFEEVNILVLKL